jgi:outer membrane protein OmpA-like peptidoglycan-associated protein
MEAQLSRNKYFHISFICLLLMVAQLASAQKEKKIKNKTLESKSPTYQLDANLMKLELHLVDSEITDSVRQGRVLAYENQNTSPKINVEIKNGFTPLTLMLGNEYRIEITSEQFKDTSFVFAPNVNQGYEQELVIVLHPKKKEFKFKVTDIDVDSDNKSTIALNNKSRKEPLIPLTAKDFKDGQYYVKLRVDDEYQLQVSNSKGYTYYKNNLDTKNNEKTINVNPNELAIGTKILLYGISFAPEVIELNEQSKNELDRVAEIIEKNPRAIIEIGGHTDNYDPRKRNVTLGQERALNVLNYLVIKGFDSNRFTIKSYGDSEPIANNSTAEGKAKNRRFELKVIGFLDR